MVNLRLFRRKELQQKRYSPSEKEKRAIESQANEGRAIRDKAYDRYVKGDISEAEFKKQLRKGEKVRRGF